MRNEMRKEIGEKIKGVFYNYYRVYVRWVKESGQAKELLTAIGQQDIEFNYSDALTFIEDQHITGKGTFYPRGIIISREKITKREFQNFTI
jgi:hypothetical protein